MQQRIRRSLRGSALLFILFVTSLVVMFMGALITTNQTSIRLATGMSADKNATANCQSGLDFCWQMLERDQTFGRLPFQHNSSIGVNQASSRLELRLKNPNNNIATQYVEGRYLDQPDAGFRVKICNRINLDASSAAPFSNVPVPPNSVMLRIEGYEGRRTRVLEATLQKAPFISHGLFSGKDTQAIWGNSVAQWEVASNDPFRNSIRSRGRLMMDRMTSGSLKFSPNPGVTASAYGRYGAALPSNGAFDSNGNQELSAADYTDASRQARGMVISRSSQNDKIKTLNTGDLKLPVLQNSLPGGVYRFEKTTYDVKITWQEQVEESYVDNGVPRTRRVWEDRSRTEQIYAKAFARYANEGDTSPAQMWIAQTFMPQAPATGGNIRGGGVELVNPGNKMVMQVAPDGAIDLPGSTGGVAARVNFSQGTFDVPADTMLTFEGSFHLQHKGLDLADARPKLRLVNQTNPNDENQPLVAAVRAKGDLTIDGGLRGSGTVVADNKLEMYAESSLATSTSRPVALYAGGDVYLKKDDKVTQDKTSQETLGEDWTMFKRSLGTHPDLDTFLNDNYGTQKNKLENLLSLPIKDADLTAVDSDPSFYFSSVTGTFFPEGDPDGLMPKAQAAYTAMRQGGLTVEEAIRFREYCRQLAIDAKATTQELDPETGEMVTVPAQELASEWLDADEVRSQVRHLVHDQLESYGSLVGHEIVNQKSQFKSLQQWFMDVATNPYENDATRDNSVFRGLVYSRTGNFRLDANYNGLTVIGALVIPQGAVTFNRPSAIKTVYDPRYLRDLFNTQPETMPIKLDQVYWRML